MASTVFSTQLQKLRHGSGISHYNSLIQRTTLIGPEEKEEVYGSEKRFLLPLIMVLTAARDIPNPIGSYMGLNGLDYSTYMSREKLKETLNKASKGEKK